MAARRLDGTVVESQQRLLLLPSSDTPSASIFVTGDHWELDTGELTRTVCDGELVTVDGHTYELELPCLHPTSDRTRVCGGDARVGSAELHLRVSQNEEHVELTLKTASRTKELPARAFYYMILTLARIRQIDMAAGCGAEQSGWTYIRDLAQRLGVSAENVNVDVHRMRQFVARQELFADPENIVERRRTTGELRIGVPAIFISSI